MPAKDLGHKFTCFKCETKFYDLKKPEPICPKCGADQRESPALKPTSKRAPREKPPVPVQPEVEESASEEEEDADEADDEDVEDEPDDDAVRSTPGDYARAGTGMASARIAARTCAYKPGLMAWMPAGRIRTTNELAAHCGLPTSTAQRKARRSPVRRTEAVPRNAAKRQRAGLTVGERGQADARLTRRRCPETPQVLEDLRVSPGGTRARSECQAPAGGPAATPRARNQGLETGCTDRARPPGAGWRSPRCHPPTCRGCSPRTAGRPCR